MVTILVRRLNVVDAERVPGEEVYCDRMRYTSLFCESLARI
jgi:hypothetical protein